MKQTNLSSQKELILNKLIVFMQNYDAKYKKSKCEFDIIENGIKKTCVLNFINRGRHLALRTYLYISIDEINKVFKKIVKNTVCPPYIYGGEITEICEYFSMEIGRKYTEQIITADTNINEITTEWEENFKKIGVLFFKKYSTVSELNKAINNTNTLEIPPLALSTNNRVLKGSLLLKLVSLPKDNIEKIIAFYNEISINSESKNLLDDFYAIKEYIEKYLKI